MFYKKKGKPSVGEIVICTVKQISFHSVFVTIDEYENVDGMIHISEIAPGRIRNLRDYVKEGKKIVCKVLEIHGNTGNIDLSLRRVGTSFMVQKLNDYKQEEKAEKMLEQMGQEIKLSLEEIYKKGGAEIVEEYGGLFNFFQDIVASGKGVVENTKLPTELKKILFTQVTEKIKPIEITIGGIIELTSEASEGVDIIKKALEHLEKAGLSVTYLGAPRYKLEITSSNKRDAGKILNKAVEEAIAIVEKTGNGEFKKNA